MTLVLASRSPQRRAILERLGIEFVLRPTDVEELTDGEPEQVARENALRKASAADPAPGELVLGVDTLVTLDGVIYGKPASAAEARETIRALSGKTHAVISGLALVELGHQPVVAAARTAVTFRDLDEPTISAYVATGEWIERSGGYAIQQAGGVLVREISGDINNVVGLPLALLLELRPALLSSS